MPALPFLSTLLARALVLLALALAGHRAAAQVTIQPESAYVLHGASRAFTATRTDGRAAQWHWTILEGAGGRVDPHTGLFQAPQQVSAPTDFRLGVTDSADPQATASVLIRVSPVLILVVANQTILQGDRPVEVKAVRCDDQTPVWAWTVEDPAAGRVFQQGGRTFFQPSRVVEPTGCVLFVRDTAHPGDPEKRIHVDVRPSLLSVEEVLPGTLPRSGGTVDLRVIHADGLAGPFLWAVLEAAGGAIADLGQGLARYTCPRVATPQTFHLQVRTADGSSCLHRITVQPTIQLTTPNRTQVFSGNTMEVHTYPGQVNPEPDIPWRWGVKGPDGSIHPLAQESPGRVAWRAPSVGLPTTFWIEALDERHPDDPARIRIQVLPRFTGLSQEAEAVFEKIMPKVMGPDWLAPAPQATLLAGHLGYRPGRDKLFHGINCITYAEPDRRLGFLSGKWLVGHRNGIMIVSAQGRTLRSRSVEGQVTAIAVRAGDAGWQVVYAVQGLGPAPRSALYVLEQARQPRVLAGSVGSAPLAAGMEAGRGSKVLFGNVHALAWDPDGGVRVLDSLHDRHLNRRIAPNGEVSVLGRLESPGLAWDADNCPLSGMDNDVVKTDPAGKVSRWLRVTGHAAALQVLGPYLFVADSVNNAFRLFNLQTSHGLNLAGSAAERHPRLGPLGYGSPALPMEACCALGNPRVFHVNAAGGCVVAQEDALMFLDLSEFAVEPPEERAAAMAWEAAAAGSSSSSSSSRSSHKRVFGNLDGKDADQQEKRSQPPPSQ